MFTELQHFLKISKTMAFFKDQQIKTTTLSLGVQGKRRE